MIFSFASEISVQKWKMCLKMKKPLQTAVCKGFGEGGGWDSNPRHSEPQTNVRKLLECRYSLTFIIVLFLLLRKFCGNFESLLLYIINNVMVVKKDFCVLSGLFVEFLHPFGQLHEL